MELTDLTYRGPPFDDRLFLADFAEQIADVTERGTAETEPSEDA